MKRLIKWTITRVLNIIASVVIILIISIIIFNITNTTDKLLVTNINIVNNKVKNEITIVHISDLHNAEFGENNIELIDAIVNSNPDIVVATGDMFDSSYTDLDKTYSLFSNLDEKLDCPVVYIKGNHETSRNNQFLELQERLKNLKTLVLNNEYIEICIHNTNVNIICIDNNIKYNVEGLSNIIDSNFNNDNLNLVLCHQPENFNSFIKSSSDLINIDLILSGHAHGGQVRFNNKGLYAPNQGWLPMYTSGLYELNNNVKLIVNRGLGNSSFPIRINNCPDVSIIKIKQQGD